MPSTQIKTVYSAVLAIPKVPGRSDPSDRDQYRREHLKGYPTDFGNDKAAKNFFQNRRAAILAAHGKGSFLTLFRSTGSARPVIIPLDPEYS